MERIHAHKPVGFAQLAATPSDRQYLLPHEEMDILVLNRFVAPLYTPRESPIAMVVGYSSIREGEILRSFHQDSYGLPHRALTVVGCNIVQRRVAEITDSVDQLLMGHFSGDAKDIYTWLKPFMNPSMQNQNLYDCTYIRNPDLYDIGEWGAVFVQAIKNTAASGVVVTLIRQDDVASFVRLTDHLEQRYSVRPVAVTYTGMSLEDDPLRQHFLLGVFQGTGRFF